MAARNFRMSQGRRSLTAASTLVTNPGKDLKTQIRVGEHADWQDEAWKLYGKVGEFAYYVSWKSGSCSRVPLVASELDSRGRPTGKCKNERVNQIAAQVAGGAYGQSQLIKCAVERLTVVGELWVAIVNMPATTIRPASQVWLALNRDEIRTTGSGVNAKTEVRLENKDWHTLVQGRDKMFRVWNPHPKIFSEPTSAVQSSLDSLYEIERTTRTIAQSSRARLTGAGVLLVPHEMSLPSPTAPVTEGKPGDPLPQLTGKPGVQQLTDLIYDAAVVSAKDPNSAAGVIPIVVGVPGDQAKNFQHIRFDNDITDVALKTRNDAIARLSMAFEISPERLLGMGSSTNHWSAWQISDEDVRLHVMPMMDLFTAALNKWVFREVLVNEKIQDPNKPDVYVLHYDTSALTTDPDQTEEAFEAYDRGLLTAEETRELAHMEGAVGHDLSTKQGVEKWAMEAVMADPTLMETLQPFLPGARGVELPAAKAAREQNEAAAKAKAIAGGQNVGPGKKPTTQGKGPGYDQGKRGNPKTVDKVKQKASLDPRMAMLLELSISRALALAGKRRRTAANHEILRDITPMRTHYVLGAVDEDQVDKLTNGWDAEITDEILDRLGLDRDEFGAAVMEQVRAELTGESITA